MSDLIIGMEKEPEIIVAYGPPGCGKSTLAAGSESPLFVGPERNGSLNVAKLKRNETHDQLCQQLLDIKNGKYDNKNFRTTVLDSIDMHENIIHQDICKKEPGKTMATAMKGFGKAYIYAGTKLLEVRNLLDELREQKEMNIIVLGHSIASEFTDPMLNTSYEQYKMCLHMTKKVDYNALFMDWANVVLFINWKAYKTEDGNGAVSIGKREILTEFRPSHYAKNRYNLPYSIDMLDDSNALRNGQKPQTFSIIQNHIDEFYKSGQSANTFNADFAQLVSESKAMMAQVNDENILPKIEDAINAAIILCNNNPQQAFNDMTVIKNRLFEITSNQ